MKGALAQTSQETFGEAAVWEPFQDGWRPLHGGLEKLGFSIEWHDLNAGEEFDWGQSFHPDSLEICLNLEGHGQVAIGSSKKALFTPGTVGFYRQGTTPLQALRTGKNRHRFLTIEFAASYLRDQLSTSHANLHPLVKSLIEGETQSGISTIEPMSRRRQELANSLKKPPVLSDAQNLWYQGKTLELMSEFFFLSPSKSEFFCERQKRISEERVDKVMAILNRDLAEPPALEKLGKEVGCSPYYLSRIFSKEKGMTIPQYLRQVRMEKAASLLASGKCNVTEAAMEVGYNSLSHFSQAFCQTIGCCPGMYPHGLKTPSDKER